MLYSNITKNTTNSATQNVKYVNQHPFHILAPNVLPILCATALGATLSSAAFFFHGYCELDQVMSALSCFFLGVFVWFVGCMYEEAFQDHTIVVKRGLRWGFILFIFSEAMLFFGIFWAYFHSSFNPNIATGGVWPPYGLTVIDPWGLPFANTALLLTSGVSLTIAHQALLLNRFGTEVALFLGVTVALAAAFLGCQFVEYAEAPFAISDGIYPSCFFLATGFHGAHVLVGGLALALCFFASLFSLYTEDSHLSFEIAAWYWHFVDVVWLFLFITIYWGGSSSSF